MADDTRQQQYVEINMSKKTEKDNNLIRSIKLAIGAKKFLVKRPAQGALLHDYLVPGGYYSEQWDWDAFFMGVGLASEIPSEAIYLRNWALNYLHLADENGYSPGCVTPNGPEKGHRAFPMKPFIAQGAYLASRFLKDFSWIKTRYFKLYQMVTYRERNLWNKELDLGVWGNWVESGADNNPAILDFPQKTIVAADVNTFILREYKAMTCIAKELGREKDAKYFSKRAKIIKDNILKYLWNKHDQTFYNYNSQTKEHIIHITYSNIVPLFDRIAPKKDGVNTIRRYLLNPKKLWAKYGIRTLSAGCPLYNNKNIIHPYSNWQGPVWPIANYLYMQGLLNYGFQKEAIMLAQKISGLVLEDIQKTGGMHECYNAETGQPLAAPNFVSWNLLVANMLEEATGKKNPFAI